MDQLKTILKAEEAFAREVALGVVVTRPLKSWLYLIPGMFIIDFLRRQAIIRTYVNHYMALRRLAVKGAQTILSGADPALVRTDLETQIGQWLATQGQNHPDLIHVQMALVELLLTHYAKLLATPGPDYHQMVRAAYDQRSELRQLIDRLNELESQCDRLLNPASNHGISVDATQGQVVMRRNHLIDAIY